MRMQQQDAVQQQRRRRGSKKMRVAIAIITTIAFIVVSILSFFSSISKIPAWWSIAAGISFAALGALFNFYPLIFPPRSIDTDRPTVSLDSLPPNYPIQLWNVPLRNPIFTGRDDVLNLLHERLSDTHFAALIQTHAINGLGGTGKTQVALEYVYRHRSEYRVIGWLQADTRDTLVTDLVKLAHLLNLAEKDEPDSQKVVNACKRWFVVHKDWLLIFDNVENMEMVKEFLPAGGKGHIVMTTCIQPLEAIAPAIEVEDMNAEEGATLLLRRSGKLASTSPLTDATSENQRLATEIVSTLGGLPLALDQAGAYIAEAGCSLAEYLPIYRSRRKQLLRMRGAQRKGIYPKTVATTWALAFRKIKKANTDAAALLSLCAFLSPEVIPEAMLKQGGTKLDRPLKTLFADPMTFNEAVAVILKYSLLKRNPETQALSIHRLVQAVQEDIMSARERRRWATRTVRLVCNALPAISPERLSRLQPYITHIERCEELIDRYHIRSIDATRLLHSRALYLSLTSSYAQAEVLYWRVVRGKRHPETAVVAHEFANFLRNQKRYEQAEQLYRKALHFYKRPFARRHSEIALVQSDFAHLYLEKGNHDEAIALYQQALNSYQKVPRPEHRKIAEVQYQLAHLFSSQDKYQKAEELYQQVIDTYEMLPDSKPFDAAKVQLELAHLCAKLSKHQQAEMLYQKALHAHQAIAGVPLLTITDIQFALARLYQVQKNYEQADTLYQKVIEIFKQNPERGEAHHITIEALEQYNKLQDERAKSPNP